jgi:hypothetical protein
MVHIEWKIKRGDLVKISPSTETTPNGIYGVVTSNGPYNDQVAMFPVVMVFSFSHAEERQYYAYNLEIVSSTT